MTSERYEEICRQFDPSLASMLNLIRQYVQANQASVMVGAGFSKNADMNPGVEMKDWNELGEEFYKRLYATTDSKKEDFYFKSPIRLASQFASLTTRAELDNVISDSLPNNSIKPGALHRMLMKLPWRDVFTTNYDTLLERSSQDWIQHYDVVTNRETLIYSKSPRIIKLHGSFPDQHPFIITEEDFRTYPKKHPEFVNTVRQSLIENLFCLIGFSGDDENFLSWIGWLRDVIGKDSVLCFMITYNKNLHDSEASLLKDRGITPVNLYRLPLKDEEGYADALDFFLTYIAPQEAEENTDWSGFLGFDAYDDLSNAITKMAHVRETYPGWPFLPVEYLDDFEDIERRAPFIGEKFEALDDTQKKSFTKEFLWRLQISFSPLKFSWLSTYLESVIDHIDTWDVENTDMALVLLSSYRMEGDFDKFKLLYDKMENIVSWGASSQIHRYIYEAALCYMSVLNIPALKGLIGNWEVRAEDTIPSLWKANVLTYLGETNEAIVLLEAAKQHLDTLLRSSVSVINRMLADVLQTSLSALDGRGTTRLLSAKPLYLSYVDKLKNDLAEYDKKGRPGQHVVHTFNIGKRVMSWHSGQSGLFGDYIYPMRYVFMRECIGYPMGANEHGIDPIPMQIFLTPLLKYEPAYAAGCVIRSNNAEVAKNVFTREILHSWNRDNCAEFLQDGSLLRKVFDSPKNKTEECIRKRVLIPFFSRLCIRFDQDNVNRVFDVVVSEVSKFPKQYNLYQDELSIIYDCADHDSKARMLIECLNTRVPEKMVVSDILMPTCIDDTIKIPDDIIISLTKAILDDFHSTDHAVRRLMRIWALLSAGQKKIARESIRNLRGKKWNYLTISTFEKIPPFETEKDDIVKLCEQLVSTFEKSKWEKEDMMSGNDYMLGIFTHLIQLRASISKEQWVRVYRQLCHLLPDVYEAQGENAMHNVFAGMAYNFNNFNLNLRRLIYFTGPKMANTPIGRDLLGVVSCIDSEDSPLLEIRVGLMKPKEYLEDSEVIRVARNRLTSKQLDARNDGYNALKIIMSHSNIYFNSIISYLASFMTKTSDDVLIQYIQKCTDFVLILNQEGFANRLNTLLREVLKTIRKQEMPYDTKTDMIYYTGVLVGVMSCIDLKRKEVIEEWIELISDSEMDTDVQLSINKGKELYAHRNKDVQNV